MPDPAQPLSGILVIDLSRHLPGPLISRLLADLGARVIKVEEPTLGDPVRHAIPRRDGQSALATLLLRGHESIALDLKQEPARASLGQLLTQADVLVESFRPGTLARLGLDPAHLRQRFPRLILCSLTGWGQTGPLAARAGHDLTYQAIAGSLAGRGAMPAIQVADIVGAWSATSAVLAALFRRQQDGAGCWIDQALLDAAGHANLTAWASEADGPKVVGEALLLTGGIPCYDLYSTHDGGLFALAALEPKFWQRFCRAVGRHDLLPAQYSSRPRVRQAVAELLASRSRSEWEALCAEHDIPGAPVLAAKEALAHPQVAARGLFTTTADGCPHLGFPALFDGLRPRGKASFPELGAQTMAVAREFALPVPVAQREQRRSGIGRRFRLRGCLLRFLVDVLETFRKR